MQRDLGEKCGGEGVRVMLDVDYPISTAHSYVHLASHPR